MKKAKTDVKTPQASLFAPFRSLGHVSTGVPFALASLSSKHLTTPVFHLLTSVGTSWCLWEGSSMRLLFVGPEMPTEIRSLGLHHNIVLALYASEICLFSRGKITTRLILPPHSSDELEDFLHFGGHAVARTRDGSRLVVWDMGAINEAAEGSEGAVGGAESTEKGERAKREGAESEGDESEGDSDSGEGETSESDASSDASSDVSSDTSSATPSQKSKETPPLSTASLGKSFGPSRILPYTTIDLSGTPGSPRATALLHPSTYLNKVVVTFDDGSLRLYNIKTGACVHTFEAQEEGAITCIEQAPAVDIVALGYASGRVLLFDLRLGEVLGRMRLGDSRPTALAFRTDGVAHLFTAGTAAGDIFVFDLSDRFRLVHTLIGAHAAGIAGLAWLPGQPVFVSNGGDNALKQFFVNAPAAPRLLKQRSGHQAPPHLIRFYGEDGTSILSAGQDRTLRLLSVVREARSAPLSQAALAASKSQKNTEQSRLAPVAALSFSTAQSPRWDDILTLSGDGVARTWSGANRRLGTFKFATDDGGDPTAVCVTACGNFGLVASATGAITMYSMESGMVRKLFRVGGGSISSATSSTAPRALHVTGLAVDPLNRFVIASTRSGDLHLLSFQTLKPLATVTLPAGIASITLNADTGLLAAICDDFCVRLVDTETHRIVRTFGGARGRVLDVAFSPDARWIVTTAQDAVIRTYDIPTGQLVDAFRTRAIAPSVAFSPTGDFLATCHVNSVGVHLWANMAQLRTVPLRAIQANAPIPQAVLPSIQGGDAPAELVDDTVADPASIHTTPEQLSSLVTLSLLPSSTWRSLLHLDTIRARNKPVEAPKAPERAPFFLPALSSKREDTGRFDLSGVGETKKESKRLDFAAATVETEFVRRLSAENPKGDHAAFFAYLTSLSPAAIDLEIRSLTTLTSLARFLQALSQRLAAGRDFEAVETLIQVCTRIHGDIIIQNDELEEALENLKREHARQSSRIGEMIASHLGVLAFIRGAPVV